MKFHRSNTWSRMIPLLLSLQLGLPSSAHAAGDITFRKVHKYFHYQGIDGDFSPDKARKMVKLFEKIKQQLTDTETKLQEPEDLFYAKKIASCSKWLPKKVCRSLVKDKRQEAVNPEDYPDIIPFLNYGLEQLNSALLKDSGDDQAYAMLIGKNILYSIFAASYEGRPLRFSEILAMPFTRLSTRIPYRSLEKRNRAIGLKKARKESRFLTDPDGGDPGHFLNAADLATMTPVEISRLDVREDHHVWHTKRYVNQHQDMWGDLETRITNNVMEQTRAYYNLHQARNLVFYKGFKDKGGTHGKIKVKDPFGIKWKL